MVTKIDTALVKIWDQTVGAVSWIPEKTIGLFEFEPTFLRSGLDIAPVVIPIAEITASNSIFSFNTLNKETYMGLPGLLADSLPDKFGNAIIDDWLRRQGRDAKGFSPVERLCYTGKRGMGALEYTPSIDRSFDRSVQVKVDNLVDLAQQIMRERTKLNTELNGTEKANAEAMLDILRVGTSAGGARPKAVIAMDQQGNVRSGQTPAPKGYDYWIVKFDGVTDAELGETKGFGRIEFAYHLMAKEAGIEMTECKLLEENGRAHFITKRFDRLPSGDKLHMQTLCGIAHYDFNMAGAYGYESAFTVMRKLRLPKSAAVQQYRRMVFNVLARNQDDHTKNIAFIMNSQGKWNLSPAYDITYSHNPGGQWTSQHQMSIQGKRDNFTLADLIAVGESISLSKPQEIINEVTAAIANWPIHAAVAGVKKATTTEIARFHRRFE